MSLSNAIKKTAGDTQRENIKEIFGSMAHGNETTVSAFFTLH